MAATRTVVHYTDASKFGGAEQMIVNLLSALDRSLWSPVLLHHDDPGLTELLAGARRHDVPAVAVSRRSARRSVGRYLRRTRPSVFHAHLNWALAGEAGLVAAALARTPGVVATQQLFAPIQSRRRVLRHRLVSAAVDRYIAVSEDTARMLRPVVLGGSRKVRVVHNGIRVQEFENGDGAALRRSLGAGEGRPIVVTLARLVPQKGLSHLVEAAAQVPDVLFVVAGDGPERPALEARATALGVADRVRFLGHRTDTPSLLAAADVFVLPSLYEGLPVSLLEAMAAGRPAIATRIGGTAEAIEDGVSGLLVPAADAAALAAAIRRLFGDAALAERLSRGARERVLREFSAETVACRTMAVYEEALGAA